MPININIPKQWNDLNPRQLKKIARLFNSSQAPKFIDILLFFALLDIRFWQLHKYYKAFVVIKNVGISDLKTTYNWLYEHNNLTKFIPSIKTKNKVLLAPASRIINLTIDEFAHTEDLFIGFNNTKDFEYLTYLAAVLYREVSEKGKRVVFDKNELDERATDLKSVNKTTLLAIALSYQGCRNYLYPKFPRVFPKQEGNVQNEKAPKSSNLGKLILSVSGKKFGTYNETKSTNLYIFLSEFEEELKTAKTRSKQKRHA